MVCSVARFVIVYLIKYVKIIFGLVKVAEWPPFWNDLTPSFNHLFCIHVYLFQFQLVSMTGFCV